MVRPEFHLGLFARTFLLLALLMLASLGAWIHVLVTLDSEPLTERISTHLANAAIVTRNLLSLPDPNTVQAIEKALGQQASLKLRTTPPDDTLPDLPKTEFWLSIGDFIQREVGPDVHLLKSASDPSAVWIELPVGDRLYWLGLNIGRAQAVTGVEWFSWVIAAALLSLVGAAVAVSYMNRPLARLARASQQLSRGETPTPLPEQGPLEIRVLNASFNRMVSELQQAENDRNLMLAGISHDLRTPLARMRLEIEMSPISEEQRQAIDQDLSQVDHTIGQLLEYARPARKPPETPVNLAEILKDIVSVEQSRCQQVDADLILKSPEEAYCHIDRHDFRRSVTNLLENARRYGTIPGRHSTIEINLWSKADRWIIDVCDQGPGVDPGDIPRLMRPFSRGETARTGVSGAGLGLSIVERLLSRAGGNLKLVTRDTGGLIARIDLPRSKKPRNYHSSTSQPANEPV